MCIAFHIGKFFERRMSEINSRRELAGSGGTYERQRGHELIDVIVLMLFNGCSPTLFPSPA
jgi:hypothetical protein